MDEESYFIEFPGFSPSEIPFSPNLSEISYVNDFKKIMLNKTPPSFY